MSDQGNEGGNVKQKFEKMAKSPFFTFSKPYLDFIGKGSIFSIIYFIMAVINLFIPFFLLYKAIDSGFFSYVEAKYVFAFILTWLVVCFACWISFQLWWNRRKKVAVLASSEFIAIPIFSEILQTFGEWLGTVIAIVGAGGGLLASLFLGNDVDYLFGMMGMEFMNFGVMIIIIGPIVGFFIIIISRVLAELFRIAAALANNTKEIAGNIKNSAASAGLHSGSSPTVPGNAGIAVIDSESTE